MKHESENSNAPLPLHIAAGGDTRAPSLPSPPHNPELRDLVTAKRARSFPLSKVAVKRAFTGWAERGYLPHRDAPGLTQFVTFRLEDCFPAERRREWEALLKIEDNRERRTRLETYLDKGFGKCPLRRNDVASVVEKALRFHHGVHYELLSWAVMPNHVHVLFKVGDRPMGQTIKAWKSYTAREINTVLGLTGKLWEDDYWDVYMRDSEHRLRSRKYMENNPVKAHLAKTPADWQWSSARYRDQYGDLNLADGARVSPPAASNK